MGLRSFENWFSLKLSPTMSCKSQTLSEVLSSPHTLTPPSPSLPLAILIGVPLTQALSG